MRIPGNFILSAAAVAAVAVVLAQPANAQMTLEELVKKAGDEGNVAMNTSTTRYPASAVPGLVTKGAPIAIAPLEKVGSQPYYMFVQKNAESPNAGALLTYFFCCTEEGKRAQLEHMNTAMVDTPGSEQNEVGGGGRSVAPTTEWQLNEQRRVAEVLDKLIGR